MSTYHDWAESAVKGCERVRANTTNKYFPQAVPGVPACSYQVYNTFDWNISYTHDRCLTLADIECSDECLRIIENQITTAPFCSYGSHYTLGEATKHYLVECLNTRREDRRPGCRRAVSAVTPAA